jgi:pilus assembly protein CpaC
MESRHHLRILQPLLLSLSFLCTTALTPAVAQEPTLGGIPSAPSVGGLTLLTERTQDLTMVVNSSHTIETKEPYKYITVDNPDIISAQPISSNKIQLAARRNGVTQVEIVNGEGKSQSVQIVVFGDARELEIILRRQFPKSQLNVTPIQTGCIVSGVVADSDDVERAISIAELYFSRVINNIQVMGVHQVLLHTQVMEVSRSKLRDLGFDWQWSNSGDFATQTVNGLVNAGSSGLNVTGSGLDTFRFGVVGNNSAFFGLIRALRQNNLVKVLADPTVVAVDGRPASFNSGGEFPIVVPSGLGQVGIEFREFGTRVDFVAKVRGDTRIALEVRPTISEIDPTRSVTIQGTTVPGLRSRFVDTAVELNAGQTLAIAGLIQVRTESEVIGIPGLSELPYLGVPFRRTREVQNEVELLILVTPELVEAMDPCEVPTSLPGFNSQSPTDSELFFRGYVETPVDASIGACPPGMQGGQMMQGDSGMHVPMNGSEMIPNGYYQAQPMPTQMPVNTPNFPTANNAPVRNQMAPVSGPTLPTNPGIPLQPPAGFQMQPYAPGSVPAPAQNAPGISQDRTAQPSFPSQSPTQFR